jgi:hypothetical protein
VVTPVALFAVQVVQCVFVNWLLSSAHVITNVVGRTTVAPLHAIIFGLVAVKTAGAGDEGREDDDASAA